MAKTIKSKVQQRRDSAANWQKNNPVLAAGEIGYDATNNRIKVGDGATAWNDLDYIDTQVQIIRW